MRYFVPIALLCKQMPKFAQAKREDIATGRAFLRSEDRTLMHTAKPHQEIYTADGDLQPPPRWLFALELRAWMEFGGGMMALQALRRLAPQGDREPVIVLPGLAASDRSTRFLRYFLKSLGYPTYSWGLGINFGSRRYRPALMNERLKQVFDHHRRRVSLIGWSLGGVYAREAAKLAPDQTRQVITLGSPFSGHPRATRPVATYEVLTGKKVEHDPHRLLHLRQKPPVPFTSIYSKTDGVVAWRCSIQEEGPEAENIEVRGASHMGLGFNPVVLYVIADRLAQPEGKWQPFDVGGFRRLLFGSDGALGRVRAQRAHEGAATHVAD